jgi:integrase
MAKAKKLPSGNWRARVYSGKDSNGKAQYKSFTESTERKANLAAMEWQEHYKAIASDGANMSVSEAIDAHISSLSNILSPATIAGYHRIQKNHLKEIISIKLSKLTEKIINNETNNEAGKYSPKTVYNAFGLLNTVLKKYRPDFKYKIDLPTVYPTIKDVPLDDDLRKIYAISYDTEMEFPFLLASWLGLRVSEIRGLKCSKIGNEKIIIEKAIVQGDNGAADKGTKSKKSTRVLPLPTYIKLRMDALITDGRERVTNLSGQAIYKRFVRICEKAGVGPFRFHDLRHTNATVMLEENVPDKYIAERGGWGSDIYKKRYEHTTANKRQSINEAIDSRFEKIMCHEI